MLGLQNISKDNPHCSFTPELFDIIKGEIDSDNKAIFLVMEYLESDMASLIKYGPKTGFTEEHLLIIIYNTLCALKFLHSANVIHRDIKPSNILVNKEC